MKLYADLFKNVFEKNKSGFLCMHMHETYKTSSIFRRRGIDFVSEGVKIKL